VRKSVDGSVSDKSPDVVSVYFVVLDGGGLLLGHCFLLATLVARLHHSLPNHGRSELRLVELLPLVFEVAAETAGPSADKIDLPDLGRVHQVDALQRHSTEPDGQLQRSCPGVPALEGKDQATVSDHLFAFESLLVGDIDNISRTDIIE
jgi:hypothetical protein